MRGYLISAVLVFLAVAGCEQEGTGDDIEQYTLSVTVIGGGSVSPDGGEYLEGSTLQLRATPDAGWDFARWEGDLTGSDNPASVVMDRDRAVTAVFVEGPSIYTLTVNVEGNGTVIQDPQGTEF